ncbi:MAG: hypothetical protein U0Z44_13140 [Kouleothrix sp.]
MPAAPDVEQAARARQQQREGDLRAPPAPIGRSNTWAGWSIADPPVVFASAASKAGLDWPTVLGRIGHDKRGCVLRYQLPSQAAGQLQQVPCGG